MIETMQKELGKTLWNIADKLRGAMNPDDFRDYMLSFLFLRYLSDNYENAVKKELGKEYEDCEQALSQSTFKNPLALWYEKNKEDTKMFEKQMRRKVHYVIQPDYLWSNITELARTQSNDLLSTLQNGFKYIENESFEVSFRGLFSEVNLDSEKLGKIILPEMPCSAMSLRKLPRDFPNFPMSGTCSVTLMNTLSDSLPQVQAKKQENFIHPSKFQKSCLKSSPAIAVNRIRKKII